VSSKFYSNSLGSKIRSKRAQTSLLSSSCFKNECTSSSGSHYSRCAQSVHSSASPHDCSFKRLKLHLPLSASSRGLPVRDLNFKNRSGFSLPTLSLSLSLFLSLSHTHTLFIFLVLSTNCYCVLRVFLASSSCLKLFLETFFS
jgi:hypothetical protein